MVFPDYSFKSVSTEDIHASLLNHGCCLLRGALNRRVVKRLATRINAISEIKSNRVKCGDLEETFSRFHITESEYNVHYPQQSLYDILSETRWSHLLASVFGVGQFHQHPETYTRGIDARPEIKRDLTSFRPLVFHLDTIYHPPTDKFAINFWIPFDKCGVKRPGLQVVPVTLEKIRSIIKFDPSKGFNYDAASGDESPFSMKNIWEQISTAIPDATIWRPKFSVGDILIMSSWLPHASYATKEMPLPRRSLELRYYGNDVDPLHVKREEINLSFLDRLKVKMHRQNYLRIDELI